MITTLAAASTKVASRSVQAIRTAPAAVSEPKSQVIHASTMASRSAPNSSDNPKTASTETELLEVPAPPAFVSESPAEKANSREDVGSLKCAALKVREAKIAARVAAAKLKAEKQEREKAEREATKIARKAEKARRKAREHAEAEAEAQLLRDERERKEAERKQTKEDLKAQAETYKQDKKAKEADEKKRTNGMGGSMWGYDPMAGIRPGIPDPDSGASKGMYIHSGRADRDRGTDSRDELDEFGRRTGKRWERGTT